MDTRSLEAEDTLRYRANSTKTAGGKIGSFVSDRKMVLHNEEQKWYWFPEMVYGQAIVFFTGKTAHSSFSLPGEETLIQLFEDLQNFGASLNNMKKREQVEIACNSKLPSLGTNTLPHLAELYDYAVFVHQTFCQAKKEEREAHKDLVEEAVTALTRASLELRCASVVMPYEAVCVVFVFFVCLAYYLANLIMKLLRPRVDKPKVE